MGEFRVFLSEVREVDFPKFRSAKGCHHLLLLIAQVIAQLTHALAILTRAPLAYLQRKPSWEHLGERRLVPGIAVNREVLVYGLELPRVARRTERDPFVFLHKRL